MMKITSTMRARKPPISAVRMPLIRVREPRRGTAAAVGAGGGRVEPLADGGGRVPAGLCRAALFRHDASFRGWDHGSAPRHLGSPVPSIWLQTTLEILN